MKNIKIVKILAIGLLMLQAGSTSCMSLIELFFGNGDLNVTTMATMNPAGQVYLPENENENQNVQDQGQLVLPDDAQEILENLGNNPPTMIFKTKNFDLSKNSGELALKYS